MKKTAFFSLLLALLALAGPGYGQTSKPAAAYRDPAQYGKPFAGVPDAPNATIYQVNLRGFSQAGNFQGVLARLDSIKALGVNVVYLMPIFPIGQVRGVDSPFAVQNYTGVNPEFGTLADLRAIVDGAHRRGLAGAETVDVDAEDLGRVVPVGDRADDRRGRRGLLREDHEEAAVDRRGAERRGQSDGDAQRVRGGRGAGLGRRGAPPTDRRDDGVRRGRAGGRGRERERKRDQREREERRESGGRAIEHRGRVYHATRPSAEARARPRQARVVRSCEVSGG